MEGIGFNIFSAGEIVQLSQFQHNTNLNGSIVTLLTATSTQITFYGSVQHPGQDSGTVTRATDSWTVQPYQDINDTVHLGYTGTVDSVGCITGHTSFSGLSYDGYLTAGSITTNSQQIQDSIQVTVTTPSGTVLSSVPFCNTGGTPQPCSSAPSTATDPNGNQLSVTNNTGVYTYDDSSGNQALTTSGGYSWTGPGSTSPNEHVSVTYSNIVIGPSNIQCPSLPESLQRTLSLPTKITLPDTSFYSITYEPSSGRVQSITLPTLGVITYTYNGPHSGVSCEDGGTSGFTRKTPDGTWTYSRSYNSTTNVWTTTVFDQPGNETIYTFSGPLDLNSPACPNFCTQARYEVQRQTFQLIGSKQVLMQTLLTCYNNNFANCATATVTTGTNPTISQIDRYTYLPGLASPSLSETKYNYGLLTEDKEFDFGATLPPGNNPVSDRVIQYGTYSGGTCTPLGKNLLNRPCIDTTTSGSSTLAQTTYQYDPNGNPQTVSSMVGSTSLSKYFTYYPSGLIDLATDVNGGTTTYTYGDCNSSYPTEVAMQVSSQLSLNESFSWDCTGEAVTSITDPNGQPTKYYYVDPTTGYVDPYWRVVAVADPYPATTHYTYAPTKMESSLLFGPTSASTTDVLSTADTQGRPYLAQTKQSPTSTNYDTVVQGYDSDGRPATIGLPCVATASHPCTSALTTTTYDNLGRKTNVSDGGSGFVSYSYAPAGVYNNDVLVTTNATKKQLEYDGLGRLTSVCEISTTLSGVGTCGQTTPQTGYWTRYKYDALGRLVGVCQNTKQPLSVDCVQTPSSGQQTRTFSYDTLGRLTSETNPESGTTTYFWDAAPPVCWNNQGWPTPGDLGARRDNAGNYNCYAYDPLHRMTGGLTVPSGPCFGLTYDSATPPSGSGIVVSNTLGQLIEAYTNNDCNGTANVVTDEWFGYSSRGETTDMYTKTPNSNGYYHLAKKYWPNGIVSQISGLPGVPTIYYGGSTGSALDGEGRPTQVTASSGTGPVTCSSPPCVSYNTAGQVTNVVFGSGDSDSYQYDTQTGRMKQYTFAIDGSSVIGNLTWNPNGTLQILGITDPLNNLNNQACTYTYDDLGRLGGQDANGYSVDCPGSWAQTFSFDPFGNITKTGSAAWIPGYNEATNQYLTASNCQTNGGTPCYDNDGKLLRDGFHTYQWNLYGHPIEIDGTSNQITYDAFGNLVEVNSPGWVGQSLRDFNGQLLGDSQAHSAGLEWVPLPGGGVVSYEGGVIQNYNHSDWLGSTRLSSTPNRTLTQDWARAPFNEEYAKDTLGQNAVDLFTGIGFSVANDLYETQSRDYHPGQGRWISPDPAGLAAVDSTNPQSWNRYAYVLNNPLSYTDPTGLYCFYGGKGDTPENDSDPTDYDFSAKDPSECGAGAQWIDNPSTTVTVSDGGNNGNTLSTFPSDISPNFQFIPGSGCSAALGTAGANSKAIVRYYGTYQGTINNAANSHGINPFFLAAVGIRETGLQNIPQQGGGQGLGVFQIDLGAHPNVSPSQALNPAFSASFAANMLSSNMSTLGRSHPNLNPSQLLQATAASYNFGVGNISGNPNTIDVGTTGNNYGSNVVAISQNCF